MTWRFVKKRFKTVLSLPPAIRNENKYNKRIFFQMFPSLGLNKTHCHSPSGVAGQTNVFCREQEKSQISLDKKKKEKKKRKTKNQKSLQLS